MKNIDSESVLFRFDHSHRGISDTLEVSKIIRAKRKTGTEVVLFTAIDSSGELVGSIVGNLSIHPQDGAVFKAQISGNHQEYISHKDKTVALPRVVGATIAQLVDQEIINTWYSSHDLTNDGEAMYRDYLAPRPELSVTHEKDRYRVTKKSTA